MSAKVAEIFETMDYGPAPESDKTASQWLEQHGRSFGHFINGAFVKPAKGKSFATKNPATGEMLAKIACGGKAEVDAAVKAAEKALKPWQALDGFGRAKYLYALARLIQKNSRLLASSRAWTTASPSAKRAISTSISPRGISITTPAGRSCSTRNSPAMKATASSARSFPGTSRS